MAMKQCCMKSFVSSLKRDYLVAVFIPKPIFIYENYLGIMVTCVTEKCEV